MLPGAMANARRWLYGDRMKTSEFITLLRRSPEKHLVFVNEEGTTIRSGYHLKELKAASFYTVDCGGQKNRWNETIVQLWVPQEADDDFVTAQKFLGIYDKVGGMIANDPDAEIRIEYGDENFFPSNYDVDLVTQDEESIRVQLRPPQTTCKARDRRAEVGVSCCD
jgi:Family of unknown function (DUF6428)